MESTRNVRNLSILHAFIAFVFLNVLSFSSSFSTCFFLRCVLHLHNLYQVPDGILDLYQTIVHIIKLRMVRLGWVGLG